MVDSVVRWWRIVRTAFGFGVFGVVAPLLGAAVLAAARLRRADTAHRQIFVQRWVHRAARGYLRFLEIIGILRFRVQHAERLEGGPHLIAANHPTLLDAVGLLAAMPQADCIVSRTRARNPFLRGLVRACGYVSNDRGPEIVSTCARRLREGRSLIVFPEGTRSPVGGLHPFQRGAAHIALVAPADVLPVVIRCEPPTLAKGQKWYDVPDRAFELTFSVGEPIAIRGDVVSNGVSNGVSGDTPGGCGARGAAVGSPLAARRLTALLHESIEKELDGSPLSRATGGDTDIGDA